VLTAVTCVQLRISTEPPMDATYDDLLAVARRAEDTGFDAFSRSDHHLTMGGTGLPGPTDAWVTLGALAREADELRANGVAGSPAEAVDTLGRYAEAGATRVHLQVLDLADLDHLDLVAAEVAPQLG
jgi:alkanesulfonate monooxygenase SsuD/methylene tetrahydromethanopterin reductase-like flavin-dependent oxidoreductase (luciferase family)